MSEAKKASVEEAKGSIKEAIGKLTGDPETENEGRRQKAQSVQPSANAPQPKPRGNSRT